MRSWVAIPLLLLSSSCGGKAKPSVLPEEPVGLVIVDAGSTAADTPVQPSDDTKGTVKPSPCTGFEMDLMDALSQSACEVHTKSDDKPHDLKGVLEVKVMSVGNKVPKGGHIDLIVTFTNKSSSLLPLDFVIDPLPRFQIEAYSLKGKRVDLPFGKEPKVPADVQREATAPGIARITLAANGKATAKLGWDASRTRWAPEKLKGTPPEQGYPRVADKPLPKGKYTLRVVTPLTNVFEGIDHEVSAPKTPIEVGN